MLKKEQECFLLFKRLRQKLKVKHSDKIQLFDETKNGKAIISLLEDNEKTGNIPVADIICKNTGNLDGLFYRYCPVLLCAIAAPTDFEQLTATSRKKTDFLSSQDQASKFKLAFESIFQSFLGVCETLVKTSISDDTIIFQNALMTFKLVLALNIEKKYEYWQTVVLDGVLRKCLEHLFEDDNALDKNKMHLEILAFIRPSIIKELLWKNNVESAAEETALLFQDCFGVPRILFMDIVEKMDEESLIASFKADLSKLFDINMDDLDSMNATAILPKIMQKAKSSNAKVLTRKFEALLKTKGTFCNTFHESMRPYLEMYNVKNVQQFAHIIAEKFKTGNLIGKIISYLKRTEILQNNPLIAEMMSNAFK